MKYGIGEYLKLAAQQKTRKAKILALHEAYHKCGDALISCLKYACKTDIKFDLPEGEPPYKKNDKNLDYQGMMYAEVRRIKNFMVGGPHPNMHPLKRETLFINTLEALDPDDAEFMILMKDKKLFKGLTKETVQAAFPHATANWFE